MGPLRHVQILITSESEHGDRLGVSDSFSDCDSESLTTQRASSRHAGRWMESDRHATVLRLEALRVRLSATLFSAWQYSLIITWLRLRVWGKGHWQCHCHSDSDSASVTAFKLLWWWCNSKKTYFKRNQSLAIQILGYFEALKVIQDNNQSKTTGTLVTPTWNCHEFMNHMNSYIKWLFDSYMKGSNEFIVYMNLYMNQYMWNIIL